MCYSRIALWGYGDVTLWAFCTVTEYQYWKNCDNSTSDKLTTVYRIRTEKIEFVFFRRSNSDKKCFNMSDKLIFVKTHHGGVALNFFLQVEFGLESCIRPDKQILPGSCTMWMMNYLLLFNYVFHAVLVFIYFILLFFLARDRIWIWNKVGNGILRRFSSENKNLQGRIGCISYIRIYIRILHWFQYVYFM